MISAFVTYLVKNQFVAGLLFLALVWILFQIKEILIVLFASYIIMVSIKPVVVWMEERKVPKILAIVASYLSILLLFVLLIFPLVPFFVEQVNKLFINFPVFLNNAADGLGFQIDRDSITQAFPAEGIGQNVFAFAGGVFGAVFSIIAAFVISIYLFVDYNSIREGFLDFFPKAKRNKIGDVIDQTEDKLGAWLRGQIVLSLFIGIVTWIILTFLQLGQYALPLAVLAGLLEIVPTVGPILAAIPAIIIGLSISPTLALVLVLVYVGIQILENNILVPRIMQKAVGLNPIVVILGITLGGKFFGIPGALLSVPFISFLVVIYKNIREEKIDL